MTSESHSTVVHRPGPRTEAPFADILCAVNGSRGSKVAARQAVALAVPDASLSFLAVSYATGAGLAGTAGLGERRAREALEDSTRLAARAGVSASSELRRGASANEILVAEGRSHSLMVIGTHGGSRAGGIMLGSTATRAAHEASRALLISRPSPERRWRDFPARILLATDGSPGSWAAAEAAARIARARGSRIEVVYVPNEVAAERRRVVGDQLAAIEGITGEEPLMADGHGHVAGRIAEVAREEQSSLIAVGRRGLKGLRALGSVSERVVHQAPCAVLVVPGDDQEHREGHAHERGRGVPS